MTRERVEADVRGGFTLTRADLSGLDLSGANLVNGQFYRTNFSGANLSNASLDLADLHGADLSNANLSGINAAGADIGAADLSGANLTGANLTNANLVNTNLSGADLSQAILFGADLSAAILTQADLSGSSWDGSRCGVSVSSSQICTAEALVGFGAFLCDFGIPERIAPKSQSRQDGPVFEFDWSDCPGATNYNVVIVDPREVTIDRELSASSLRYDTIPGEGAGLLEWTWKVRAYVDSQWGAWSETQTFMSERYAMK